MRVNCVVDGDTFWVDGEKIRIADLNAPEISSPKCASEARLGARATDALIVQLNAGPFALEAIDRDEDRYGRKLPKHAHGTVHLPKPTLSAKQITTAVMELCDRILNPDLSVRRINVTANRIVEERTLTKAPVADQLDLFADSERLSREKEATEQEQQRERKRQEALLSIKKKYGKNAILKASDLQEGATAIARNGQIGGHKA